MRRKHFVGIGLFFGVILSWTLLYHPNPHPTDAALIDYFQMHRADFERLVSMAHEDSFVRTIYPEQVMLEDYKLWPTNTNNGFTQQRWSEYKRLFAKLHQYRIDGFSRDERSIRITASVGVSNLDDYEHILVLKGYVYSVDEPTPLVESLDGMGFDSRGTYYRKIGEHWYLYHEWDVSHPE